MRERGDEEAGCELAQVESDGKEVWSASRDVVAVWSVVRGSRC
jgi:hypothetical protein